MAGTYHVDTGEGVLECTLRGRVKARRDATVAVGDRVRVERLDDGSCRIRRALPRRTTLSRHGVARRREQVIAANVDQVAAIISAAAPSPDLSMVDRLLALAEINRLEAFIVLNKADLLPPAEAAGGGRLAPELPSELAPYRQAGYDVLLTSAEEGSGLEALRERLEGRITALAGPSGAGKSSLVNALLPGLDLRVGEVGERKRRGRHTTVSARLIPLPGGGYVADTPGLQVLGLWEVEPREVAAAFPELRKLAPGCRFADCRHDREPGCAVHAAAEAGEIPEPRYRSYLALLRETLEGRR